MSTPNRSRDLIIDTVTRLKNATAVTNQLPDGAANIHPGPVVHEREEQVSLVVREIGGSATRRGRTTEATHLVQIRVEASASYFESQSRLWIRDVFDATEAELEGLGGGGRAPAGRGGGIQPQYNAERNRYEADTTVRFRTTH